VIDRQVHSSGIMGRGAGDSWPSEELINPDTFAIRIADGLLIFSEILEDYKEVVMQGFVYGKHYSVTCTEGEIGDAHRATFLAVITQEMFETASNLGWVVLRLALFGE